MKKIWELKQSVDTSTLNIYVYGDIEGDGYDWWTGETLESETSATHFRNELEKYPDVQNINLFVNSNGGSVIEAMGIRNQLIRHPAMVTGFVDGFACSAGSFILTGCDKVVMYSNTMQMLHNMWMGAVGNHNELRKVADDLEQISIGNRQAYLEKSNGKLTEEQLIEILDNETWLTAEQCLEYGLCDEVIAETKDLIEAQKIAQHLNKSLEQQLNYNKALVALKKQATEPAPVRAIEPEPPEPESIPEQENKLLKFLQTI